MSATDTSSTARTRLSQEIEATKKLQHETRLRLEELERVAEAVSDISFLRHVSDETKEAAIDSIVNEALTDNGGKPTSLIERVRGGKA